METTGYDKIMNITETPQNNHLDTIQAIIPHPDESTGIFFSGGWDGIVKVWRFNSQESGPKQYFLNSKVEQISSYKFQHPVLSLAISSSNMLFVGLSSGMMLGCFLGNTPQSFFEVGRHNAGVVFMTWNEQHNFLLSLGLNNCMIVNQLTKTSFQKPSTITLPAKTCCASYSHPYLIICSLSKIKIFNLNHFDPNNIGDYTQVINNKDSKINCVNINAQAMVAVIGTVNSLGLFFKFREDGQILFESDTKHHTIQLSKKDIMKSISAKHERYPVNSTEILFTQIKTDSYISLCFGINRKLFFYSLPTKTEINAVKTFKDLANVTALKYCVIKGFRVLMIGTGNNWEEGLQGLSKEHPVTLSLKEISSRDICKNLNI